MLRIKFFIFFLINVSKNITIYNQNTQNVFLCVLAFKDYNKFLLVFRMKIQNRIISKEISRNTIIMGVITNHRIAKITVINNGFS